MISVRMTTKQRELTLRFFMEPGEVRPGVTRQRCRKCRGYLWITGKKVHAIDGLYCTFECSTWTQAEIDAFDAWWALMNTHCGCRGSRGRKTMYESEQEAIESIRIPFYMRVYACPKKPEYFHLTKKVKGGTKASHA